MVPACAFVSPSAENRRANPCLADPLGWAGEVAAAGHWKEHRNAEPQAADRGSLGLVCPFDAKGERGNEDPCVPFRLVHCTRGVKRSVQNPIVRSLILMRCQQVLLDDDRTAREHSKVGIPRERHKV